MQGGSEERRAPKDEWTKMDFDGRAMDKNGRARREETQSAQFRTQNKERRIGTFLQF